MTVSRTSDRDRDPLLANIPTEELEITRLIFDRLAREECMESEERETIAYRIAEIMVAAKRMFTVSLPRLTNVNGESTSPMDEDLEGLRMTFLHLRDLLQDFDSGYLAAMHHEAPAYDYDGELAHEEEDAPEDPEDEQPVPW